MGSPASDTVAFFDERPPHRVRITRPFYLGKYLVTQEQWKAVMGSNPSQFKGATSPVESVRWDECQKFLEKLSTRSRPRGGKFQLPTEAQWEYACRAGSTTRYCFGDDKAQLGQYAWYAANADDRTHPVGQKKPNAWGLYDMHGNLWEWCADWYDGGYYAHSAANDLISWTTTSSGRHYAYPEASDPAGPSEGTCRVMRGGCWDRDATDCRSAFRGNFDLGSGWNFIGLRVCQVPADE